MDVKYKRKAVTSLVIGVTLLTAAIAAGLIWWQAAHNGKATNLHMWIFIVLAVLQAPFYLVGCVLFAKAKGYTGVLALTCVLGWITPFVILLAIPDKLREPRKARNRRR